MKRTLTAVVASILLLVGCGEPKVQKLGRMHAINPTGQFYVEGKVEGVGTEITKFKAGEVEYTNLRLSDDTGNYTFYFLPAAHTRQPVAGDQIRATTRFVVLDSSFAGGGRAPIIEKFEFK